MTTNRFLIRHLPLLPVTLLLGPAVCSICSGRPVIHLCTEICPVRILVTRRRYSDLSWKSSQAHIAETSCDAHQSFISLLTVNLSNPTCLNYYKLQYMPPSYKRVKWIPSSYMPFHVVSTYVLGKIATAKRFLMITASVTRHLKN